MSKNLFDTSKKLIDSPSFRRLVELSEKYSKILPKNTPDDSEWNNFSGDETPVLNSVSNELGKKQLENLVLLTAIAVQQAETTDKQFKSTKLLTYIIIGLTLFSIGFTIYSHFQNNTQQVLLEKILKLKDKESQNTETTLILSNRLLDLENQVKNLEKQNEVLSIKKID